MEGPLIFHFIDPVELNLLFNQREGQFTEAFIRIIRVDLVGIPSITKRRFSNIVNGL